MEQKDWIKLHPRQEKLLFPFGKSPPTFLSPSTNGSIYLPGVSLAPSPAPPHWWLINTYRSCRGTGWRCWPSPSLSLEFFKVSLRDFTLNRGAKAGELCSPFRLAFTAEFWKAARSCQRFPLTFLLKHNGVVLLQDRIRSFKQPCRESGGSAVQRLQRLERSDLTSGERRQLAGQANNYDISSCSPQAVLHLIRIQIWLSCIFFFFFFCLVLLVILQRSWAGIEL